MFKQKLILATFALATLFFACNDNEEIETTTSYPVEIFISFPEREQSFQYPEWDENRQIAAFRTDNRYVNKVILSQTDEQTYIGTSVNEINENSEFAFLYPASASTVSSSDTLTQILYINQQDGSLEGLSNFDYAWGTYTYDTSEEDYVLTSVMTPLISFCKFQFTENGRPIEHISQVIITSPKDNLYVGSRLNLENGTLTNLYKGSIVIRNSEGLSNAIYAALFPSETELHFTISTLDGKSYEAILPEMMEFKAGDTSVYSDIACSSLEAARIGDYYYNDATWSTSLDENKTCIGIVYALDDLNGNLDKTLTESTHGRVVALSDGASQVNWCISGEDIEGIENQTVLQDTMYVGSLPYVNGTSDSFFSEDMLEQLNGIQINPSTGQILTWYSKGTLSDFDGQANTLATNNSTGTFYAPAYCRAYNQGLYGWHLPSAGELALLWTLHRSDIICHEVYAMFEDFDRVGYWTSSEYDEGNVWYINFLSGMITKNSKNSTYNARPVIQF